MSRASDVSEKAKASGLDRPRWHIIYTGSCDHSGLPRDSPGAVGGRSSSRWADAAAGSTDRVAVLYKLSNKGTETPAPCGGLDAGDARSCPVGARLRARSIRDLITPSSTVGRGRGPGGPDTAPCGRRSAVTTRLPSALKRRAPARTGSRPSEHGCRRAVALDRSRPAPCRSVDGDDAFAVGAERRAPYGIGMTFEHDWTGRGPERSQTRAVWS